MSKEYVASVLKRLRIKSGLTADEVGEMVGKSGKTVSGWENARSQPDAEILLQLCDIYKVDNILQEFNEIKNTVQTIDITLSEHERKIILAYRNQPAMQKAVDRVLAISEEAVEYIPSLVAARSQGNDVPIQVENVPDLSKIEPDDSDL